VRVSKRLPSLAPLQRPTHGAASSSRLSVDVAWHPPLRFLAPTALDRLMKPLVGFQPDAVPPRRFARPRGVYPHLALRPCSVPLSLMGFFSFRALFPPWSSSGLVTRRSLLDVEGVERLSTDSASHPQGLMQHSELDLLVQRVSADVEHLGSLGRSRLSWRSEGRPVSSPSGGHRPWSFQPCAVTRHDCGPSTSLGSSSGISRFRGRRPPQPFWPSASNRRFPGER